MDPKAVPKGQLDGEITERSVTIDGRAYHVALAPPKDGLPYVVVRNHGEWEITMPLPVAINDLRRLWYRELLEIIDRAEMAARHNNSLTAA